MVAVQAIADAVLATLVHQAVPRIHPLAKDPQTDLAIKALIGVGMIVATALFVKKDGWAKTALIGAGVGLALGAGIPLVQGYATHQAA
jgi:uncharacterized protein YqgC (DUF456 family)